MAEIFIGCYHLDGKRDAITGLNFKVVYDGIVADVSVPEMPPMVEPNQSDAVRAAILRLGEAIVEAARSPGGLLPHPLDR
jgi:hypothetical protein